MNENWKMIHDFGSQFVILQNEKTGEYNLASGYDKDSNTWAYGHYFKTFDNCLVSYLKLKENPYVKSDKQINIEQRYGIDFERMDHIASKCLRLIASEDIYMREDLLYEFDFTVCENNYFNLGFETEKEWK